MQSTLFAEFCAGEEPVQGISTEAIAAIVVVIVVVILVVGEQCVCTCNISN